MYMYVCNAFGPGGTAHFQDGIKTGYMNADFVLLVHKDLDK